MFRQILKSNPYRGEKGEFLGSLVLKLAPVVKPLYVSRRVGNPEQITAWAKSQGFKKTLPPEKLHVTIVFSREPVDWFALEHDFSEVTISSAGGRSVESLGDAAVVLKFQSALLQHRWQEFRDIGASWDHDGYHPHITLSYEVEDLDLSKVEPYTGPILLSAESYEPLDLDWKDKVVEKFERLLHILKTNPFRDKGGTLYDRG